MKHLVLSILIASAGVFGLQACKQTETPKAVVVQTEGEFWAKLLVMEESALSEFDKPSHQIPEIREVDTAEKGDRVALKLIFTGMDLSADNRADISFDIEVTSPDGSPYDGGTHKNIQAFDSQIPDPKRMFNSNAVLVLEFDHDDQIGTYNISMLVKDNVSGQELPLKESVTLEK